MLRWYNESVGPGLLQYAQPGEGRRLHILDTTWVEVALETGSYECSGGVADDDGRLWRGYKLATLRTLLDTAGIITQADVGPIQRHDHVLCAPLLSDSPVLRSGDLRLMDRGLLDGATITDLKRRRGWR